MHARYNLMRIYCPAYGTEATIGNAIIAKLIPRSSSLALAILINCFWRPI